MTLFNIIWN